VVIKVSENSQWFVAHEAIESKTGYFQKLRNIL
jgi:hypothetical protein